MLALPRLSVGYSERRVETAVLRDYSCDIAFAPTVLATVASDDWGRDRRFTGRYAATLGKHPTI